MLNGRPPAAALPAIPRGLLLGWNALPAGQAPPDFAARPPAAAALSPVLYDGDAPLLTCGRTGSGKGRGALVPTLLLFPGSVITVDIKGELCQVTARRRRGLGQDVVALDPFHLASPHSGGLSPFDLLTLPRACSDADAQMLASQLAVGHISLTEPFWHEMATSVIAGLIAHIATAYPPGERHLGQLRAWLYHPEMDMALCRALDAGAVRSRFARDQLAGYLAAPEERTRPAIRAEACNFINALCSDPVAATRKASTFRRLDLFEGQPLSIFIIIPADKLEALKPPLRLWVGTLLTTVSRRPCVPRERTLFLLDECAQLGKEFAPLRQAVTLLRGSGLQVWSFWQDLSQLRGLVPPPTGEQPAGAPEQAREQTAHPRPPPRRRR